MSGHFLTTDEISGIFVSAAALRIMAAGVSLLMISGEFDLSVGSMFAITPIVMGEFIAHDWNPLATFSVSMLILLLFGLLTTRFPSFTTSLASYFLLDGVTYIITGGQPVVYSQHPLLFSVTGGSLGFAGLAAPIVWMVAITLPYQRCSTPPLSGTGASPPLGEAKPVGRSV